MQINRLSIPGNVCIHCGTVITKSLQCQGCGWVDPLTESKESYNSEKNFMTEAEDSIKERAFYEQQRKGRSKRVGCVVALFLAPFFVWLLIQLYKLV